MRFSASAGVVFATAVLLVGSTASAASLNLTGALGASIAAGTDGDVTYSGNAAFGGVTFVASPNGSDLTYISGSGLGINCPSSVPGCRLDNAYQIDTPEVLTVRFDQSLYLTSVDIAKLSTTGFYILRFDETGSVVGDGFDINFDSDDATNGFLTVNVNRWVTLGALHSGPGRVERLHARGAPHRRDSRAPGPTAVGPRSNPIPEPSSVLLMIVGAGIVATQVRRFV